MFLIIRFIFVFLFFMFCFLFCAFCVFVLFCVLFLSMHLVIFYLCEIHLQLSGQDLPLIRIFVKLPNAEWTTVCENISSTPLSDETRSACYRVIHDLIPTQVLLHGINIQNTRACVHCNNIYPLLRPLTMCTATSELWQWTRHRIVAVIVRIPDMFPHSGCYSQISPFGRKINIQVKYG